MTQPYPNTTTRIAYNPKDVEQTIIQANETSRILYKEGYNIWLHSYGTADTESIKAIILNNGLDDFLIKLIFNDLETNRVIDLEDVLFLHLHIFSEDSDRLETQTITFITSPSFVWSIQDSPINYFENITSKIVKGTSLVSRKKADYLLGLMIENIINSYEKVLNKHIDNTIYHTDIIEVRPTPSFMQKVEGYKQKLFVIKKSALSLRDSITKIENTESIDIEEKYFNELKEQVNNVLNDIDFHMHTLESKINLLFSIQGHRLNEIMKTLTIFSVIFIPLTFIAGIYGMNFKNMPELEWKHGYYYSLLSMLIIVIAIVLYIRHRFKD